MKKSAKILTCIFFLFTLIFVSSFSVFAQDYVSTVYVEKIHAYVTLKYCLENYYGINKTFVAMSMSGIVERYPVSVHLTYYSSSFNVIYSTSFSDPEQIVNEIVIPSGAKYVNAEFTWKFPGETVTKTAFQPVIIET